MFETFYLLLRHFGGASQRLLVESLGTSASAHFDPRPEHAARIAALIKTYADLPMYLADASVVILARELGHRHLRSTDTRDLNA